MTKLPRLLDENMKEMARLHPTKVGLQLQLEPLSTATMTLPKGEPAISVGDWVELYVPGKSAGIFRAVTVGRDYEQGTQTVELEHGAASIGDAVVPGRHVYYGWSGGDMAVNAYVAVTGSKTQYAAHDNIELLGRNEDGTAFLSYADAGVVLPAIVQTDSGWKILYTRQVHDRCRHVVNDSWSSWDGQDTTVTGRTDLLIKVTPYSAATGAVTEKTKLYKHCGYRMGIGEMSTPIEAGTRLTVHGAAYEDRRFNPYKGEVELFFAVETPSTTGWIPAKYVTLDPGYVIGGDTGKATDHFKDVATSLFQLAHDTIDTGWAFGESDFDESFGYVYEDVNLMDAIMAMPAKLEGQYRWEFDQTSRPWRINLRRLDEGNMAELRTTRNLSRLRIETGTADLVTCVYPIGQNGQTVASVNGGSPYVYANNATNGWHSEQIYRTEDTDANALYESAVAYLMEKSQPTVTITVSALDLSEMTGEPLDRLELGKMCRVVLPSEGLMVREYITELRWADVYTAPEQVTVTLANKSGTASGILAKLLRK